MVLDVLHNYKCLELVVSLEGSAVGTEMLPAQDQQQQGQQQQQQGVTPHGPNALHALSSAAMANIRDSPQVSPCVIA